MAVLFRSKTTFNHSNGSKLIGRAVIPIANSNSKMNLFGLAYFGENRIEPLCSPACHKRQVTEASRGLPAEAIPSVVKV